MPKRTPRSIDTDTTAPSAGPNAVPGSASSDSAAYPSAWARGLDRFLSVQRPLVLAHIRSIRRRYPGATPAQLQRILERRYLAAITTGGAAVGATAMVPVIGTGVTVALSGVETAGFLEVTALFAQSVAEVHGIAVQEPVRARALVMTIMLGNSGQDLLRHFAGSVTGQAAPRRQHWGEVITKAMPQMVVGPLADQLKSRFIKHAVVNQGSSLLGKTVPFGIGAAIGGVGNHVAGRQVVRGAREAFGPAPHVLPAELEPRARAEGAGAVARALSAPLRMLPRIPGLRRRDRSPDESAPN